jgi:hypothetical protein
MADIFDLDSTASNNNNIDGVNIQTNMSIANIDNAFRSLAAIIRNTFTDGLKNFLKGTAELPVANGGTGAATLTGLLKGNGTAPVTAITMDGSTKKFLNANGAFAAPVEAFICKVTSDSTAVATGAGQFYFDAPYDLTITGVIGALGTAQASGSLLTFDVNKTGSSIFSTRPTFDNTEVTTSTAATAAVITTTSVSQGNRITIDVDQIGNGSAKGLTVTILAQKA